MNEEIKIQIRKELYATYPQLLDVPYNMWLFIERKLEESYLQGAKDAVEAVKIEKENRITRLTQQDTGDVSDGAVGYEVGYENARYKMNKQAQQFIDSLERKKDVGI